MKAIGNWIVIKMEETKSESGLITRDSNEGIVLSCGSQVESGSRLEGKKVLFNLHNHQRWGEYYIVDYENVYMVIE